MGQAAPAPTPEVDLPDPNDAASAPSAASADDLLAQLAGEEIDRLLAEADGDSAALAPAAPPSPASNALPAVAPVDRAAPAATSSEDSSTKADQLDALLKQIDAETTKSPASEAPAPLQTIAELGATTSNEVNALLREVGSDEGDDDLDDVASDRPPSILVRVLELVNLPVAALGDSTRELLGKIAILTLFNSIAVLLYVLLFRRG